MRMVLILVLIGYMSDLDSDKGGGGVKKAEKSAYVLNGSPLIVRKPG